MPDSPTPKRWYEVIAQLTPLIIGIAVTGVGTFFTASNNSRQTQLNQITALEKFRSLLTSSSIADREFAYAAFAALGYEQLAFKIIQAQQDPAGRAVAEQIKQTSDAPEQAAAAAVLASTPAKVYIQIASESQRDRAQKFGEQLRKDGYAFQGVENIAGKATPPMETTVRFFNTEDQATAVSITEALKVSGDASAKAKNVTRFKVKPGSIEVWFAKTPS